MVMTDRCGHAHENPQRQQMKQKTVDVPASNKGRNFDYVNKGYINDFQLVKGDVQAPESHVEVHENEEESRGLKKMPNPD